MTPPPDLAGFMMGLASQGLNHYEPKTPVEARTILNSSGGAQYIISTDLKAEVKPENLDGDSSTFTPAEKKAWAHFEIDHGMVAPFGDYVFSRGDVLGDRLKSSQELQKLYRQYKSPIKPPTQWVYLKVEDWKALFDFFKIPKSDEAKTKKKILETLQKDYSVGQRRLNIRFTYEPPKVKDYKTIFIATKPTSTAGSFLARTGNSREIALAVETAWCEGRDFSLESWTNQYPKAQLLALLQHKIWQQELFSNASPDPSVLESFWESEAIKQLKTKIPAAELPQNTQGLFGWMQEQDRWHRESRNNRIKFAYTGSLEHAAEGLIRDYIRQEQEKGKNLSVVSNEMAANSTVKQLLSFSLITDGIALWGCDHNYGNQHLTGVVTAQFPQHLSDNISANVKLDKLLQTIAHETGHLLGLQHYFVSGFKGDQKKQTMMVAGGWRNDLATEFAFLPEDQAYLGLFLGYLN